jgi:hypothetical protein
VKGLQKVAEATPLGVVESFAAYRSQHPPRPPNLAGQRSDDELSLLPQENGLKELDRPPSEDLNFSMPSVPNGKYLWVVASAGLPYALELSPNIVSIFPGLASRDGRISRTNLTGGGDAHSGGEMWFPDKATIILNGGSGRYPPRSPQELADIVVAFRACGWRAASMGWDTETNGPSRVMRGVPQWE